MKWILRLAVVLVVLVVAVLGAGYFFLNQIVQKVVVDAGSEATGTTTTLAGVGLSPFSGEASLSGFGIGNPAGYAGQDVISFASADVQIDTASLLTDVIQVPRFHIDGATVNIEYADGKLNIKELLDHLAGDAPADPDAPEPDEPADGAAATKVVISDLQVLNTRVNGNIQVPGLDDPVVINAVVPDIVMTNIGSDGSGVTAKQAMQLVLEAVLANASKEALKLPDLEGMLKEQFADLQGQAEARLDEGRAQLEEGRERLDAAKQQIEDGREQLEGLKQGLGGLFGGKNEAADDPAD